METTATKSPLKTRTYICPCGKAWSWDSARNYTTIILTAQGFLHHRALRSGLVNSENLCPQPATKDELQALDDIRWAAQCIREDGDR